MPTYPGRGSRWGLHILDTCKLTQAGGWIARANPHTTARAGHREHAVVMKHSGAKRQRCYIVKTTIPKPGSDTLSYLRRARIPPVARAQGGGNARAAPTPAGVARKFAGPADCYVSACPRARRLLSVCVPRFARARGCKPPPAPTPTTRTGLVQRRQEPRVFTLSGDGGKSGILPR